ncbi:MAG: hypothetical protein DI536_16595 [Archangium gephyra]|uniref:Peptidase C-terminal archaeal/bacterial domain-containing protein n=1 Tax=Archangium gephyra TaxID=48 RepID=A0A2W5V7Y4_9BACT|nr:MAG: hypothetical protein DI536_16595 [Archangium gephyra]
MAALRPAAAPRPAAALRPAAGLGGGTATGGGAATGGGTATGGGAATGGGTATGGGSGALPGENCVAPIQLAFSSADGGSTLVATRTINLSPYQNDLTGSCNSTVTGPDVEAVMQITLSETRDVQISVTGSNGLDAVVYVRQSSCMSGGQLACVDATYANQTETVTLNALAPGAYFLVVEAYDSAVGVADVRVTTTPYEAPDAGPFVLLATNPPDGGVLDGGAVTATFSRALDSATVTANSATCNWRSTDVVTNRTLSPDRKTLSLTSAFPLWSSMTCSLTSALQSNGESFTGANIFMNTRAGAWVGDNAVFFGDISVLVDNPKVAGGAGGYFATWSRGNTVRAGHSAGTTWTDDAQVSTALATTAPDIAANDSGRAVVIWAQNQTSDRIFVSRWVNFAWNTPVRLDTATNGAGRPHVTMDAAGNILAVWEQRATTTGPLQIHYARFDAATSSWSAAQPIGTGTGRISRIVGNSNGDAIIGWEQYDVVNPNATTLMISLYTRAGGFTTPVAIGAQQPTYGQNFALDITESGKVALLANQNATSTNTNFELRQIIGQVGQPFPTTWTVVDTGNLAAPAIALGEYGQTWRAWLKQNGTNFEVIASNELSSGSGYSTPTRVSLANSSAGSPVLRASDEHAHLVFPQGTSVRSIRFNGLTGGRSLGVDAVGDGGEPALAVDRAGRASLLFVGSSAIRANHYR